MTSEPKFHTLSTAAPILGLSPRTLLTWCGNGTIRAYRPSPKGSYLVILTEVEEDIKAKTVQEKEPSGLTKERVAEIMERSRARIAEHKRRTGQLVVARGKKAPALRGQTVH